MSERPFLALEGVSFAYGEDERVVDRVDIAVGEGAVHCLVGRSGCGKTTLLKLAAGLLKPTEGGAYVGGAPVSGPPADVSFVFQTPSLLEWRTVINNVLLPFEIKGGAAPAQREEAERLLEQLGVGGLADRHPNQLSGGQQSRVALARALITQPRALLMDEPFAALDALTRDELQDDLLELVDRRRTTVLFVTHDIAEAVYLGDVVSTMHAGRISVSTEIDLPKPRAAGVRYAALFNAHCRALKASMTGRLEQAA